MNWSNSIVCSATLFLFGSALVQHAWSAQPGPSYDRPLADSDDRPRTPLEVWLSGEGWDEDYASSHVCLNGYRWVTRNIDQGNSSAAQAAYPVRC